jgi:hypothetical protein
MEGCNDHISFETNLTGKDATILPRILKTLVKSGSTVLPVEASLYGVFVLSRVLQPLPENKQEQKRSSDQFHVIWLHQVISSTHIQHDLNFIQPLFRSTMISSQESH